MILTEQHVRSVYDRVLTMVCNRFEATDKEMFDFMVPMVMGCLWNPFMHQPDGPGTPEVLRKERIYTLDELTKAEATMIKTIEGLDDPAQLEFLRFLIKKVDRVDDEGFEIVSFRIIPAFEDDEDAAKPVLN